MKLKKKIKNIDKVKPIFKNGLIKEGIYDPGIFKAVF